MAERSVLIEDQAAFTLPVTIRRRSHVDPYPNGTLVMWHPGGGTLFDELDPDLNRDGSRLRNVREAPGLTGIVVDRVWHVCHLELMQAEIDPVIRSDRTQPHLRGVNMDLHYRVMFSAGLFWARYDWLDEVGVY